MKTFVALIACSLHSCVTLPSMSGLPDDIPMIKITYTYRF